MLDGRRVLVTGVLTRDSIAFATARRAQELGAEVILTGFGRTKRMTERASGQLPQSVDVLELDVNSVEDVRALHGELTARWGRIDGLLHAIAFAPPDALGGELPRNALRERPDGLSDERLLAEGAHGGPARSARGCARRGGGGGIGFRRRRGLAGV